MRKRIGLFIGEVVEDNYSHSLVNSLGEISNKNNMDLFVFCNYGIFEHNLLLYEEGEKSICGLPVLDTFDGIIVDESLFHIEDMANELYKILKENAKCPVIYLKSVRDSFISILMSDKQAFIDITNHLIYEHGLKDICHVTGRWELQDAHTRYEGYREAMTQAGIAVDDTMIFYGDYWRDKAKDAVDYFYSKRDKYPEAIVCANDYMALSIIEELISRNVRVPEDVCVTGYDNVPNSRNNLVPLTTFDADPVFIARKSFEILQKLANNENVETINYVQNKMILRNSCGCIKGSDYHEDLCKYIFSSEKSHNGLEHIFFMTTGYNTAFNEEEIINTTDFYFDYTSAVDAALVLTEDAFSSLNRPVDMISSYPDTMVLKRLFHTSPKKHYETINKVFDRKDIIPEEYMPKDPCVFLVHSIHAQNKVYGYMVSRFNSDKCPNRFYQAYLGSLATAIDNYNFRNKYLDVDELRQAYLADELTGIYNRRGFENNLNILSERAKRHGYFLSLVCIDMDDLKYINDNFGHSEGDTALKTIANVLSGIINNDEICARIGGDEFAVILLSNNPQRHLQFNDDFDNAIQKANESNNKNYKIHASYGIVCVNEHPGMQLNICLSMADAIMYRNKKIYKKERGELPR